MLKDDPEGPTLFGRRGRFLVLSDVHAFLGDPKFVRGDRAYREPVINESALKTVEGFGDK